MTESASPSETYATERTVRVQISGQLLLDMLTAGSQSPRTVVTKGIPKGAKIAGTAYDGTRDVLTVDVEHPEFSEHDIEDDPPNVFIEFATIYEEKP